MFLKLPEKAERTERGDDEKGGNKGHVSKGDRHGQRTPDVSHPASEGQVTMDTATDPARMPYLLIPLKLHLCVSVPLFLCGCFPV